MTVAQVAFNWQMAES